MWDLQLRLVFFQWRRAVSWSAWHPHWAREGCFSGTRWPGKARGWWQGLCLLLTQLWVCVVMFRELAEVSSAGTGAETWNRADPSGQECGSVHDLVNCCSSFKLCRLLYYSWIPKVPLIANPLSKTVQQFLPWAPWRALSRWEYPCWQIMAEPSVLNVQRIYPEPHLESSPAYLPPSLI